MSTNAKRAIVGLVGGMGLIFLFIGALAHVYPTLPVLFLCLFAGLGGGR